MSTIVTTQEELDAAIERGAKGIVIDSPPTVWLELRGSSYVVTQGSSHVVARELSYAVALGSSHVEAREWSHVEAWGSSNVVAWDLSRVDAREWSAVRAWGDSHVNATPWVTVHRHSTTATVTGGNVIDITSLDLSDPAVWTAHHGVVAQDGAATVYKAVIRELVAGQGRIPTTYAIDSTVEATDWDPAPQDGHGLHFSPTPFHASLYYPGVGEPRFLACEVDVTSLVPLGDKCKAPSCRVLHEVDQSGEPVVAALDTEQETTP